MSTSKRLRLRRDQFRKIKGVEDLILFLLVVQGLSVEADLGLGPLVKLLSVETDVNNPGIEVLSVEINIFD